MNINHVDLPEGNIDDLFPYKDGQKITAPETKEVYTIKEREGIFGADFRLSTFRGMSPGAVHYYGCITQTIFYLEKNDLIQGGYCGGIDFDGKFRIEIVRTLSKEEVKSSPERWGVLYEDSTDDDMSYTTGCFNDVDEIIDEMCKVYDKWFKGQAFQVCGGIPEDKNLSLREHLILEKDYL